MSCPHDYATLGIDIAGYLHAQGVTQDFHEEQVDGDRLAVFIGPMADQPNRAVSIVGPWIDNADSNHSTVARFMVATRSDEWDIVGHGADCQDVFTALHRDEPFALTAAQSVFFCERVISDPPVQDQNRRWVRVDTYSARLQPPTK